MAQILKLPEFSDTHRMAQVDVGRGRIKTLFNPQRLVFFDGFLELIFKFALGKKIHCPPGYYLPLTLKLFFQVRILEFLHSMFSFKEISADPAYSFKDNR